VPARDGHVGRRHLAVLLGLLWCVVGELREYVEGITGGVVDVVGEFGLGLVDLRSADELCV